MAVLYMCTMVVVIATKCDPGYDEIGRRVMMCSTRWPTHKIAENINDIRVETTRG